MQSFLWLYVLASLKMVSSKMEPLSFFTREEEILSPLLSHRRKTVPSTILEENPVISVDWNNFISNFSMENMGSNNIENSQLDSDEFIEDNTRSSSKEMKEAELLELSTFLKELLQQPGTWKAPLFIIDEPFENVDGSLEFPELQKQPILKKRSRYYRRYPWKRQNSRSRINYDYDTQYLCTPSKEEVFRLLIALHDARRNNNKEGKVRFCNRHRPAGSVFTNIRFLGRRK